MSVTPEDILNTALFLAGNDDDEFQTSESNLRSAASRAYYAAMHATDISLPDDLALSDEDRHSKDSHKAVVDAVTLWAKAIRQGRTEAGVVARNLPRLKNTRKKADYRIGENFSNAEAQAALVTAKTTIESAYRAAKQCKLTA